MDGIFSWTFTNKEKSEIVMYSVYGRAVDHQESAQENDPEEQGDLNV